MSGTALTIVDAANVVGSRPDGWWRDRPGAARRLIAELAAGPNQEELVIVLEGAALPGHPAGPAGDGIQVVHAAGSGDDEIVRIARDALAADPGRQVTVVTADRALRDRVSQLGATTAGPRSVRP
jgi:hypothetical protein